MCGAIVAATAIVLASATPGATAGPSAGVGFLQGEQLVFVSRPASTLEGAIRALLAGPTKVEASRELTTQLPAGTPLRSATLRNGLATIDLGEKFATGARAESLSARVAQVVLTATRFPGVKSVQLLVKGGTPLGLFPGFATRYPLTEKAVRARTSRRPRRPRRPSRAARPTRRTRSSSGWRTSAFSPPRRSTAARACRRRLRSSRSRSGRVWAATAWRVR